jgi:hypothetical protein
MTNEELEAVIAAGKEAEAELAKRKTEPDWGKFHLLLETAKGRYAPDMVKLADFVVYNADAFAAAPHFPVTAMTEAEIEALARECAAKTEIEHLYSYGPTMTFKGAEYAIRETLSRVRPEPRWPSEEELEKMMDASYEMDAAWGSMKDLADRIRAYQQGGDV